MSDEMAKANVLGIVTELAYLFDEGEISMGGKTYRPRIAFVDDAGQVLPGAAERNAMVTLITAVMPPDAGRDVLLMRVEAKHAQAALLQRATRAATPAEAEWAMQRADALLQDCTSVLLPVS